MNSKSALALGSILLYLSCSSFGEPSASAPNPASAFHSSADEAEVPKVLYWRPGDSKARMNPTDQIHVHAWPKSEDRIVSVQWRHLVDDLWLRSATSNIAVRYTPTAICAVDQNTLAVAGTTPSGASILEAWHFSAPSLSISSTSSGEIDYQVLPGDRTRVDLVFRIDQDGFRFIHSIAPLRSTERPYLVNFYDGRKICTVTPEGQLTLVASSQQIEGAMHIPELGLDIYREIRVLEHVDDMFGILYVLPLPTHPPISDTEPGQHETIVLFDAGKDGDLDYYLLMNAAQWQEMGFHDADNFVY